MASELLKELFFEETGTFEPDTIGKDLMTKAIKGRFGLDYSCRITLNKPIIGIGAPVAAYYPQVAEKFDCELILPKYAEVGNAVGAITGASGIHGHPDKAEARRMRSMIRSASFSRHSAEWNRNGHRGS